MSDEENMRLIFRPTSEQYNRIQNMLNSGRYKHLSEILRQCVNIGLDQLEKENNQR